ncbi:cupin domain-containing protein [Halosegnis marinus]|uniref:Cupin domain-containing protein n=1 Tax=Halosegnis marinus TaxID=3034023 RepID=A0ABD5ZPV8_9EURY|nr:cupin domain-containing protein [Halosegnis sp. DT85]
MAVDLDDAFDRIDDFWDPHVAAELNGQHVKLARLKGEFDWHRHDDADELFYVHEGDLTIRLRDDPDIELSAGQLHVVPAGVEHQPVAEEECRVLLFEPAGTLNTGNVESERTVVEEKRLD